MPTDQSDPVAVLRRYFPSGIGLRQVMVGEGSLAELMPAIADLERRQGREKRLEALVRELGKCRTCCGTGRPTREGGCPDCAGTGLVEAARKELKDG